MWLWASVGSAILLGLYDVAKKTALKSNGVMQILLFASLFSTLFLSPFILSTIFRWGAGTLLDMGGAGFNEHKYLIIKSFIVTISWISGYYGIKALPITTAGIIKASRPVFVILGSILIFSEKLNAMQWSGVVMAMVSLYLLSRSSQNDGTAKERRNGVFYMVISVAAGVISALFDKYIMGDVLEKMGHNPAFFVQSWCNFYITVMLATILLIKRFTSKKEARQPFRWDWKILLIAALITLSDFLYFFSLSDETALLSIISMIRRSSVVVTFICGALIFKENNIRRKGFDMLLLLAGMALLVFGSA